MRRSTAADLACPQRARGCRGAHSELIATRQFGHAVLIHFDPPESLPIHHQNRRIPEDDVLSMARADRMSFISPQLLTAAREAPEGDGWLHEVKFDGFRLAAHVEGGRVRLYTRGGHDWTQR